MTKSSCDKHHTNDQTTAIPIQESKRGKNSQRQVGEEAEKNKKENKIKQTSWGLSLEEGSQKNLWGNILQIISEAKPIILKLLRIN